MSEFKIVDSGSIVVAAATLLATFIIFFRDTNAFIGSFVAASMTAGLVWGTYVIIRWLLLANRN